MGYFIVLIVLAYFVMAFLIVTNTTLDEIKLITKRKEINNIVKVLRNITLHYDNIYDTVPKLGDLRVTRRQAKRAAKILYCLNSKLNVVPAKIGLYKINGRGVLLITIKASHAYVAIAVDNGYALVGNSTVGDMHSARIVTTKGVVDTIVRNIEWLNKFYSQFPKTEVKKEKEKFKVIKGEKK